VEEWLKAMTEEEAAAAAVVELVVLLSSEGVTLSEFLSYSVVIVAGVVDKNFRV
jgi:hypothetical protein